MRPGLNLLQAPMLLQQGRLVLQGREVVQEQQQLPEGARSVQAPLSISC
jgi:hypothetical protein